MASKTGRSRLTAASFERGREFVYATARVVEQRLFATLFRGAPATGVVDALRAYRNDDGHGLEPGTRAPASQPVDVWFAFDMLVAARAQADDLVLPACDRLATLGVPVPIMLPSIRGYPQARHWRETADFPPGLFGDPDGQEPARPARLRAARDGCANRAVIVRRSRVRPRARGA